MRILGNRTTHALMVKDEGMCTQCNHVEHRVPWRSLSRLNELRAQACLSGSSSSPASLSPSSSNKRSKPKDNPHSRAAAQASWLQICRCARWCEGVPLLSDQCSHWAPPVAAADVRPVHFRFAKAAAGIQRMRSQVDVDGPYDAVRRPGETASASEGGWSSSGAKRSALSASASSENAESPSPSGSGSGAGLGGPGSSAESVSTSSRLGRGGITCPALGDRGRRALRGGRGGPCQKSMMPSSRRRTCTWPVWISATWSTGALSNNTSRQHGSSKSRPASSFSGRAARPDCQSAQLNENH